MQKIFVETFGCAANFAESEIIKGLLAEKSFEIVETKETADIIILNICTVKGNTRAMHCIQKSYSDSPKKKLVIAGCIPQDFIPQIKAVAPTASIINTHNVHKVTAAIENILKGAVVELTKKNKEEKLQFPRIRKNPIIGIVQISQGCDSACAFCSVKFIKGQHVSYSAEKIVRELENCVKDGCKEIWLTGQDTSCYGIDIGTNLPDLLKKLIEVKGDFKIRLGMANPKHIKNYLDALIKIFESDKMFKFLHIPIQSGNDAVLASMKRQYSINDVKIIVSEFRKAFPDITLSTDIICGFPGETAEQFADTVDLVKELQFDAVNISRFVARNGTPAAKMQCQINSNEKKLRTQAMTTAFVWTAFERNKFWKDWQGDIIIDESGRHNSSVGRNYTYKPIVINGKFALGEKVNVKIIDYTSTHLKGEINDRTQTQHQKKS